MGENTLLELFDGDEIQELDPNQSRDAFIGDLVPRNTLGAPEDSFGNLGTPLLQWNSLFFTGNLVQNGQVLDLSAIATGNHLILSGKETLDGFPDFLAVTPAATTAEILAGGSNPNLEMIINGASITLSSDITTPSMLLAPSIQNTCRVDDLEYDNLNFTKTEGEMGGTFILLSNIQNNISALDGTVQAFSHGAGPELFFARINDSEDRLEDCVRGLGGTLREELDDNDIITLLAANHIFIEDDLTIYTTRTYPEYLQSDPSSPTLGDFYFDTVVKIWKRYNGVSFEALNVNWLGTAILDDVETIFVSPNNFDLGWNESLERKIGYVSATQISVTINEVSVAGVFQKNSKAISRIYALSTNLEPGRSEIANTLYYIYVQRDLTLFFSDIAPREYDWRKGYYHPRRYWRCIGSVFRDVSGIELFHEHGNQIMFNTPGTVNDLTASATLFEHLRVPVLSNISFANYRTAKTNGPALAFIFFLFRNGVNVSVHGSNIATSRVDVVGSNSGAPIQNGTVNYREVDGGDSYYVISGYTMDYKNGNH